MSASNTTTLVGKITSDVQFLQTKAGIEFGAKFLISVKRGYKKKDGYEATDLIPIRILGEKRMNFAHKLKKGDRICLSGSVSSDLYESKTGEKQISVCIDADQITWTESVKPIKPKAPQEVKEAVVAEAVLEFSLLPFQ